MRIKEAQNGRWGQAGVHAIQRCKIRARTKSEMWPSRKSTVPQKSVPIEVKLGMLGCQGWPFVLSGLLEHGSDQFGRGAVMRPTASAALKTFPMENCHSMVLN
jgi:hypothetical protein